MGGGGGMEDTTGPLTPGGAGQAHGSAHTKDYAGKVEPIKLDKYDCKLRENSKSWGQVIEGLSSPVQAFTFGLKSASSCWRALRRGVASWDLQSGNLTPAARLSIGWQEQGFTQEDH